MNDNRFGQKNRYRKSDTDFFRWNSYLSTTNCTCVRVCQNDDSCMFCYQFLMANIASGVFYNFRCFKPFSLIELKCSRNSEMLASFLMRTISGSTAVADARAISLRLVVKLQVSVYKHWQFSKEQCIKSTTPHSLQLYQL